MPRIIPAHEVRQKTAALRSADLMGRAAAQDYVNREMAKLAGKVLAGEISVEEFEKAAGLFSRMGTMAQSGAKKAWGAVSGVFKKKAPIPHVGTATVTPPGHIAPPKAKMESGWGNIPKKTETIDLGRAQVQRQVAPNASQFERTAPGRVVPKAEASQGWGQMPTSRVEGRPVTPAGGQGGPYRSPGEVTPAGAPQKGGKPGFGWGKAALLGAGGLGVYTAMKAVPWAARQLEQTKGQTMAPNMGWSPVSYGYGPNPYGEGSPTMGYGG